MAMQFSLEVPELGLQLYHQCFSKAFHPVVTCVVAMEMWHVTCPPVSPLPPWCLCLPLPSTGFASLLLCSWVRSVSRGNTVSARVIWVQVGQPSLCFLYLSSLPLSLTLPTLNSSLLFEWGLSNLSLCYTR